MQEWDYVTDEQPRWSVPGCIAVIVMVVAFWAAVIGGGLWLADNVRITDDQNLGEQAP